jgi:DNA-directed RNA polymerase specialized sigma24 family protein
MKKNAARVARHTNARRRRGATQDEESRREIREFRLALRMIITGGVEPLKRTTVAFEVADWYECLTGASRAKLRRRVSAMARRGRRADDAEDLQHEAMLRLMSGKRRWPDDVSLEDAIVLTVRSIISSGAKRRALEDEVNAEGCVVPFAGAPRDPERILDVKRRIRQALSGFNPLQCKVLLRAAEGFEPDEIRRDLRLTETQYETITRAHRRLRERIRHLR